MKLGVRVKTVRELAAVGENESRFWLSVKADIAYIEWEENGKILKTENRTEITDYVDKIKTSAKNKKLKELFNDENFSYDYIYDSVEVKAYTNYDELEKVEKEIIDKLTEYYIWLKEKIEFIIKRGREEKTEILII